MKKMGLLSKIVIAILLGIGTGIFAPEGLIRLFLTFNGLFSQFLNFIIPLIIVGLIVPAIAEIGRNAGKMLVVTTALSYGDTLLAGFISYFVGVSIFPSIISPESAVEKVAEQAGPTPFFTIAIPEPISVMTALVLAFMVGLGLAYLKSDYLKNVCVDFKDIINGAIQKVIIPLLPLYIFGIFMNMTYTGQVHDVVTTFIKIIGVIFVLHIVYILFQYIVGGIFARKRPLRLLRNMMPAYFTALGTQSSAATIPVTLKGTLKNGVSEQVAGFVVPLCATIHLSGSTMKIVACALALMIMEGIPYDAGLFAGFIFMLGVTMVAAPGVPGGAIMASLGVLSSMLGFDENLQALMIALYIAMDSFGTACNVIGDGVVAVVIERIYGKRSASPHSR